MLRPQHRKDEDMVERMHSRVMKGVRGMENLCCEGSRREVELCLEKRRTQEQLRTPSSTYRGYRRGGGGLLTGGCMEDKDE